MANDSQPARRIRKDGKPSPGEEFARGYVRPRLIRCTLCLCGPEAVKFIDDIAATMEADRKVYVPRSVVASELKERFGYEGSDGALSHHIRSCMTRNPWARFHGGAR